MTSALKVFLRGAFFLQAGLHIAQFAQLVQFAQFAQFAQLVQFAQFAWKWDKKWFEGRRGVR